jgi:spermidine synthase
VAKKRRKKKASAKSPKQSGEAKAAERDSRAVSAAPPASWIAGLYALVGAAALVHEVTWTRVARGLLGGDAAAVAVTLVAILGGMGLGGLLAPRVVRRWGALGGFARVEGAAALIALSVPWIAPMFDGVVGATFRSVGEGPAFTVVSLLVAMVLFAPPSLAMGAGLPLLAQARAAAGRTPRDAGLLYSVHAAGGVVGGLAAAFWLVPDLGVPTAVALAGFVQLGVAGAAQVLARSRDAGAGASAAEKAAVAAPTTPFVFALLTAAGLAGAGTASLQALWARMAGLSIGPSTQGFAIVAGLYVLALSIGALITAPLSRRVSSPAAWYAGLVLAAGAAALFGIDAVGSWPAAAARVYEHVAAGETPPWLSLSSPLLAPVIVPIALAAAAFPFGVAALGRDGKRAPAHDVGWLVAAGALGNVGGVLFSTFWWVPAFGLSPAFVASAIALATGGALAAVAGLRGTPRRPPLRTKQAAALALCFGAVIGGLFAAPRRFDPDALTRGPFLYAGARSPELGEVVFVHHGVEATVTVRAVGSERLLQIDGKVDGSGRGDAPTQILVGLLPALLAESPTDALVIGLGTGATADAVRSVPGVDRVEVAELVDGVRWAAPSFARFTDDVLGDERIRVRPVDGTLVLRHGERKYDLIVSEPSNAWVAGMGELFSREAFEAARERLNEGGIFAAWFHVYGTDMEIVRSIAATFYSVFPDATLWELVRGQDYMLVGRRQSGVPIHVDLDAIAARVNDPEVQSRLTRAGIGSPPGILARLVTVGEGVGVLGGDSAILEARDGGLEARAARVLYSDASAVALSAFAELPGVPSSIGVEASTPDGRALAAVLPQAIEAGGLGRTLTLRALSGEEDAAINAGERAIGLLPDDPALLEAVATLYLSRGKTHALVHEDVEARDALMTVLELDPPPFIRADALTTLGDIELRSGRAQLALGRYQEARRLTPADAFLTEKIAACLEALGADDQARAERRLADRIHRAVD